MKRIITVILAVFGMTQIVFADTCSAGLTGVFPAAQAAKLCTTFGDAVNQSLIPAANDTYDLGTTSLRWQDLFLSGTATIAGAVALASTITSSVTTTIGWSVVAAANQACNTTCTSGCVVGQDTGTANVFVACDGATADVCLCAGAS